MGWAYHLIANDNLSSVLYLSSVAQGELCKGQTIAKRLFQFSYNRLHI